MMNMFRQEFIIQKNLDLMEHLMTKILITKIGKSIYKKNNLVIKKYHL